MIRFQCPACRTVMKCDDRKAGQKVSCPKCGQRLLIPAPAAPTGRDHTALGKLPAESAPSAASPPWLSVAPTPQVSAPPPPPASAQCPRCAALLTVPPDLAGKAGNCPRCGSPISFPDTLFAPAVSVAAPPEPLLLNPEQVENLKRSAAGVGRFVSLPFLAFVLVLGFLPWVEVSCSGPKQVALDVKFTQSGYQAVYGGLDAPPGIEEAVQKKSRRLMESRESLEKRFAFEKSDLLMGCSPALAVFFAAVAATLLAGLALPTGKTRMVIMLLLLAVAAAAFLVQRGLGLPLERRMSHAIAEMMAADEDQGLVAALSISSARTGWFWASLLLVLAAAGVELVVSSVWKSPGKPAHAAVALLVLIAFLILGTVGSAFGLVTQVSRISEAKEKLAELDAAEEAKRRAEEEKIERIRHEERLKAERDRIRREE